MLEKCNFVNRIISHKHIPFFPPHESDYIHQTRLPSKGIYANRAMRWFGWQTKYSRNECMHARYNDFRVNWDYVALEYLLILHSNKTACVTA